MKRVKTIRVRNKRVKTIRQRGKKVKTNKVYKKTAPKIGDKWHKNKK